MGFLNSFLNASAKGVSALSNYGREMQQLRDKYASYSDSRLVSICRDHGVFGSSSTERTVAFSILKERHGEDGVREMLHR